MYEGLGFQGKSNYLNYTRTKMSQNFNGAYKDLLGIIKLINSQNHKTLKTILKNHKV